MKINYIINTIAFIVLIFSISCGEYDRIEYQDERNNSCANT